MFCKLGLGFEAPFPLFTCTNSCSVSLRPFPSLFPAPTSLLHLQEDRSRGREKVQPCLLKPQRGRSRWRSDPSWVVSLPTWRLVLYVPLYDPLQSEKKFFLFIKPSYPGPSLCHQLSLHPRILGQARGLPVAESHLFKGFIIMCYKVGSNWNFIPFWERFESVIRGKSGICDYHEWCHNCMRSNVTGFFCVSLLAIHLCSCRDNCSGMCCRMVL